MKEYKYEVTIDGVDFASGKVLLDCHVKYQSDRAVIRLQPYEALELVGKLLAAAAGHIRYLDD